MNDEQLLAELIRLRAENDTLKRHNEAMAEALRGRVPNEYELVYPPFERSVTSDRLDGFDVVSTVDCHTTW